MAVLAVAMVVVPLVIWRWPRTRKDDIATGTRNPVLYPGTDSPVIHATNGVPTLQQPIEGIKVDARGMGLAEGLYDTGLVQFNRYVNNRDGVIEDSRREMANLAHSLSGSDLSLAEPVGIELAASANRKERVEAQGGGGR